MSRDKSLYNLGVFESSNVNHTIVFLVFPFTSLPRAMIPQSQISLVICTLLVLIRVVPLSAAGISISKRSAPIARPGCNDTCGEVSIPFPFGIGSNCSLDHWFEIECKETKPFLSKFDIELMETYSDDYYIENGDFRMLVVGMPPLNMCVSSAPHRFSIDLRGSPYDFSTNHNHFIMEGCAGCAVLSNESSTIMAGCSTVCRNHNSSLVTTNNCNGVECCQTSLPSSGLRYPESPLQLFQIDVVGQVPNSCMMASLISEESLDDYVGKLKASDPSNVPVVLRWSWISNLWPDSNRNASCDRDEVTNVVSCECVGNNRGNPYVSNGCQVPKECKGCDGYCSRDNSYDAYNCFAIPRGPKRFTLAVILGLSIGLGLGVVLLGIGCYELYRFLKRRKEMKQRAKFFKRNGGLLLQQQLSSSDGVVERTKVFAIAELEKATDHFNESRILGQGGQGTVYKGMLSDGRIVAVKKSKLLHESQLEQFINEVVILSQINHRHVVRLLGCCLETEVPLLVYEFIPNGTLAEHIHDPSEDFVISWPMRLKIAADSAGAIAYLHSASAIPIYHRDIKSSNILLDDKNRVKVSDFGSSKTIAIDQTHLTTLVQGTMGYLDPEYFQSYQFTEKSDVYSFGVVLLELLTGKKAIYRAENMQQKNLVTEFLFLLENSRVREILDHEVVKEASDKEMTTVIELAKRCLSWKGKMRPTMKEVTMTLEMIIKSPTEVSTEDQQAFLDEGFGEFATLKTSDLEFMSSPVPTSAASPLCIDVQPLLCDTI